MAGNVYQRPDTGTWEFRKTIRGRRYYESIPEARTKPQAEVAAARILLRIYEGKYGREGGELGADDFADFAERVYLPHAKDHVAVATYSQIRGRIERLKAFFKGRTLGEVTIIEIEKYRRRRYSQHTRRGRPPKGVTVKADLVTLSALLGLAVDAGRLATNPCRKLKWKKGETDSSRDRILSDEEEAAVMPHLSRFFEVKQAVRIALNTGMREMEVLRLHERDFDFAARTVSFIAKGGKQRLLPLNEEALAAAGELLACRPLSGHLFRNRSRYQLSTWGPFGQACREAGVEGLVFHDLRRTFSARVQRLARAFVVRDLMGHSDVKTTNDHYAPESLAEMRRVLESLSLPAAKVVQMRSQAG